MGGGEHHPGLPVANPTVSYWQIPPHPIAEHRTTGSLPTSVVHDYVIVGSGISGAAIAYKLLARDPNASILMLEARTAASGASGRNGGHCRTGRWLQYKKNVETLGEDEALKFETLEEQNVQDIANFVREHHVDCDFQDVETVDAYLKEENWAHVKELVRMRDEVKRRRPDDVTMTKRKLFEGQAAEDLTGIQGIVGAVTYPAHTQNPYLLVCRMLELSLEKGLNLQTTTPVYEFEKDKSSDDQGSTWAVKTSRGTVRTKNVILATNAYTNTLHAGLARTRFMWPARNQVTAIRPGSKISGNPALRRSTSLEDAGASGDYFMSRAPGLRGEGDILYGGARGLSPTWEVGITDDASVNPEIAAYQKHAAPRYFGREAWGDEGEYVRDWTGIVCYTTDTFPLVGEVPGEKGMWASVGMNGHGMAMAFRSAEALVHTITTGKEPDWFPKCFRIARAWEEGK